jgi:ABC-2 type transport system permease protein
MVVKEVVENRWKLFVGSIVALVLVLFTVYSFVYAAQIAPAVQAVPGLSDADRQLVQQAFSDPVVWMWANWFAKNAGMVLAAVAAFVGGGAIAGEVSRGTIFLLLSRPLSRDRVLLTKYAVGAGIVLAVDVIASLALGLAAGWLGHPQPLGGLILSTLLLWAGTLSILGVGLLFSALSSEVLRPVAGALVVGVLIGVVGLTPNGRPWDLTANWSSLPAYQGQAFPAAEFAICLLMAAIPLVGALLIFRRRAF